MESTADPFAPRVLIVDADRQTREAVLVYFRILGYAASVAGNAAEAQAAMEATFRPDHRGLLPPGR